MPKKRTTLTKAQQEAAESFAKMQKRLSELPKFGSKYPTGEKKKKKKFVSDEAKRAKATNKERLAEARAVPSLKTSANSTGKALPKQYEGDLKDRELKARKVKHAVAPIANKMGYGLITDAEHFKTMGKKT